MNMEHDSLSIKLGKANERASPHHTRIICHMNMHDTPPAGKTSTSLSKPTGETLELLKRRPLVCRNNIFEINIRTTRKLGRQRSGQSADTAKTCWVDTAHRNNQLTVSTANHESAAQSNGQASPPRYNSRHLDSSSQRRQRL